MINHTTCVGFNSVFADSEVVMSQYQQVFAIMRFIAILKHTLNQMIVVYFDPKNVFLNNENEDSGLPDLTDVST